METLNFTEGSKHSLRFVKGNYVRYYLINLEGETLTLLFTFKECYKYTGRSDNSIIFIVSKTTVIPESAIEVVKKDDISIIDDIIMYDASKIMSIDSPPYAFAIDSNFLSSFAYDSSGNVDKTKSLRLLIRGIPFSNFYFITHTSLIPESGVDINISAYKDSFKYTKYYFPIYIEYSNESEPLTDLILAPEKTYIIPILNRYDTDFKLIKTSGQAISVYISKYDLDAILQFQDVNALPPDYDGSPVHLTTSESEISINSIANIRPEPIFIKSDYEIKLKFTAQDTDSNRCFRDLINSTYYYRIYELNDISVSYINNYPVDSFSYLNDKYKDFDLTSGECFKSVLVLSGTYTVKFDTSPYKAVVFKFPVIRTSPGINKYTLKFETDRSDTIKSLRLVDLVSEKYNYNTVDICEDYILDKNNLSIYFVADKIFFKFKSLTVTSREIYELYCKMTGTVSNDFTVIPPETYVNIVMIKYPAEFLYFTFNKSDNTETKLTIYETNDSTPAYSFDFIEAKFLSSSDRYIKIIDVDINPDELFLIMIPDNGLYYLKYKMEISSSGGNNGSWIYTTSTVSPTNVLRMVKHLLWGDPIGASTIEGMYIDPNSTFFIAGDFERYGREIIYGIVRGDKVNLKFYIDENENIISFTHNIVGVNNKVHLIMDYIKNASVSLKSCAEDDPEIDDGDGDNRDKTTNIIKVNKISDGDSFLTSIERSRTILNLITGEKKEIPLNKKLVKKTYDLNWKLVEIYHIFPKDPRASDNPSYYLFPTKKAKNIGETYAFNPRKKKIDLDDYEFIVYDTIRSVVESDSNFIFLYLVEASNIFFIENHKKYCEKVKIIKRVEMRAGSLWEINAPIDVVFSLSRRFSSLIADIESYAARFYDTDGLDPDFMLLYVSMKNDINVMSDFYRRVVEESKIPTFIQPLLDMNITDIENLDRRVSLIKKIVETAYPTPYYIEDISPTKRTITSCDFGNYLIEYFVKINYNPHFMKDYIFNNEEAVYKYTRNFKDYSAIDHDLGKFFVNCYKWYDEFGDVKKKVLNRLLNLPLFYETFFYIFNILTRVGPNEALVSKIKNSYIPQEHLVMLASENVIPDSNMLRDRIFERIDVNMYNKYFIENYVPEPGKEYYDLVAVSTFMQKIDKIEPIDYFYRIDCPPECGDRHPQYKYFRARYRAYHDRLHLTYEECECYNKRLPPGTNEQYLITMVKSVGDEGGGLGYKNDLLIEYRDFVSGMISSSRYRDVSYLNKTYTYSVMGLLYAYLSLVPEDGPHLIPIINNVDDDRYISKIYHASSRYNSTVTENILISKIETAGGAYNWYIDNRNKMDEMYSIIKSDRNIEDPLIVDIARTFCKDTDYWISRCKNFYFRSKIIYASKVE